MPDLTLEAALRQLASRPDGQVTFDYLEKLIKTISVNDFRENTNPDATLYLYSGRGTKDTYVLPEQYNPDVRIIHNTHLGRFISSDNYKKALVKIYMDMGEDSIDAFKAANAYIRGTGTSGPWVEASRRFVQEAQCAVKVFLNDPGRDRVWWQVEMPAAMENDKITTINGIPQRQLAEIYHHCLEGRQLDMVCELTAIVPAENVDSGYLDRAVLHYDRHGKIVTIDPSAINGIAPDISEAAVFAVTIGEVKGGVTNVKMSAQYPGDDSLSALEKLQTGKGNTLPSRPVPTTSAVIKDSHAIMPEVPLKTMGNSNGHLTKGEEPTNGRMSMANWKAQIAQMKANDALTKKPAPLKTNAYSHER